MRSPISSTSSIVMLLFFSSQGQNYKIVNKSQSIFSVCLFNEREREYQHLRQDVFFYIGYDVIGGRDAHAQQEDMERCGLFIRHHLNSRELNQKRKTHRHAGKIDAFRN